MAEPTIEQIATAVEAAVESVKDMLMHTHDIDAVWINGWAGFAKSLVEQGISGATAAEITRALRKYAQAREKPQ